MPRSEFAVVAFASHADDDAAARYSPAMVTVACPACAQTMQAERHDNIEIDRCACGSLWFDAGELATWRAARLAPLRAVAATPAPAMRCPRCATQTLREHTVDGVPVRNCGNCRGVFVPGASVAKLEPRYSSTSGFGLVGEAILQILTWLPFG